MKKQFIFLFITIIIAMFAYFTVSSQARAGTGIGGVIGADSYFQLGEEIQISPGMESQYIPEIYGNKIVWQDCRSNNFNIYMYDIDADLEKQISPGLSSQHNPAIYGDKIVWTDHRNNNADIYMYDIGEEITIRITDNLSNQYNPDIYGNKIVWNDRRNNHADIYMYDLETKEEEKISFGLSNPHSPKIYNNKIVWTNFLPQNNNSDIYLYDMEKQEQTKILANLSGYFIPDIYNNKIVWSDYSSGNYDIYMYDLDTAVKIGITDNLSNQHNPVIHGNKIAWEDRRSLHNNIYIYDLFTDNEYQVSNNLSSQFHPAVYGNKLVWQDSYYGKSSIYMRDIYKFFEAPPAPAPNCGDGDCNGDETCSSCSADCGVCPASNSGGGGGGGAHTPPDRTPPAQPTDFKAVRGDKEIILTWSNPSDFDFDKVLIIRSAELTKHSLSVDDLKNKGKAVYEGKDEKYNDSDIAENTIYYYTIIAYDRKLNYANPLAIEVKIGTEMEINKPEFLRQPNEEVVVLGMETDYRTIQFQQIITDAGAVWEGNANLTVANTGGKRNSSKEIDGYIKYTRALINGFDNLWKDNIYALTNFIAYGTKSTMVLGEGERAGVINSYKSAFDKLPTARNEWEDVIKIANGRWPGEINLLAETRAKIEFRKIYKKSPNMNNTNDNAAVTVIAYGLRPSERNLNSEKASIKTFKHIYGYAPVGAVDWDVVRAIAYSGATR